MILSSALFPSCSIEGCSDATTKGRPCASISACRVHAIGSFPIESSLPAAQPVERGNELSLIGNQFIIEAAPREHIDGRANVARNAVTRSIGNKDERTKVALEHLG